MTIENLATIEDVRKYHFDPKEVIKGLNGYYESDKCNSYITVRRNGVEGPAHLYTPIYLSALIEWLRVDHDIFYRPGLTLDQVEAAKNAAKMCGLRAHIKDELSKRGLWCDKDADIPALVDTLFEALDCCDERADDNRKDAAKLSEENRELKKELNALKDTVSQVRARLNSKFIPLPGYEEDLVKLADIALRAVDARDETINRLTRPWHDECKDIMSYIRQEASRNGFDLPEEIDGGPLTVKRVFHDLLELLKKKEAQRKAVNEQRWNDLRDIYKELGCDGVYSNVDDFAKAVKARAEYVESLSRNAEWKTRNAVNEQLKKDTDYVADVLSTILEALGISKSNTVHLDVFGLKTKAIQRASAIKSEHDRYLEQLNKAAADYQALDKENQELKNSQKSDANKLIRDCCTNHGIIAPSRYLSDEASVEYVFSLLDSYSKQRNEACVDRDRVATILQDLYRDIFHKDCTQFTYEDIATKILDKVLGSVDDYKLKLKDYILKDIKKRGYRYDGLEKKSIEDIVDWIIEMGTCADKSNRYISDRIRSSCKAHGVVIDAALLTTSDWSLLVTFLCGEVENLKKEVEDAQKETKRKCYWYLWEALKKLSPECDALKIDCYENLVDRIFYEMSLINGNCKRCQRKHSTEKFDYIRRTNKAEEEVKKLNDVIKKLKELLNEINKEEDEGWFKP